MEAQTGNDWQIVWLRPDELTPHPDNPRVITDESVRQLVEDIQTNGVQVPLHVTPEGKILGGHRRHHAARLARVGLLPCIIREIPPADQLAFIIQENVQRQSLSPIEEGEIYQKLLQTHKKVSALCRAKGLSSARVVSRLQLMQLPKPVRDLYHQAKIPLKAAPWLLEVKQEELMVQYAQQLADFVPLAELQAQHAALLARSRTPANNAESAVIAEPVKLPPPIARRTKEPHEALLPVFTITEVREVYLQNPPFTASSTKLARVSKQTCDECGNVDQARCRVCPLYLFLKNLPVPSTLELLARTSERA